MWNFIWWIWSKRPGAKRRSRLLIERFKKIMAGPFRITVIRHDLSREVVATGLTRQQVADLGCDLITDEPVLNFELVYDGPEGA
jgi:hypothetical protein